MVNEDQSIAEHITVSEAVSIQLNPLLINVSSGITVTDTPNITKVNQINVNDTVTITESTEFHFISLVNPMGTVGALENRPLTADLELVDTASGIAANDRDITLE